ncbi:MAG: hypothetical protein DRN13_01810, partial [Thermoplasmata archaeon]
IWVWLQDGKNLMKAVIDYTKGSVTVYENDRLIYLRIGLSKKQLKDMEKEIEERGGKRLHAQSDPFVFI